MDKQEILIGVAAIIASILAFWLALPRGGEARKWLGGDFLQACFIVLVLAGLTFGLVNVFTGVIPG